MKIAGIDMSKNSPGIVKLTLDDKTLEIISVEHLGFTTVKKNESTGIIFYSKKDFNFDENQLIFIENAIFKFLDGVEYCSFEDFAYGANGNITDLAQSVGYIKMKQFIDGKKLRIYAISQIKAYATGSGGSDKLSMYQSFMNHSGMKPDISKMPIVNKGHGVSPTSDICDAFFIAELLRTELQLRKGLIKLSDLSEKKIQIFNTTSKAFPTNILARDFIQKG